MTELARRTRQDSASSGTRWLTALLQTPPRHLSGNYASDTQHPVTSTPRSRGETLMEAVLLATSSRSAMQSTSGVLSWYIIHICSACSYCGTTTFSHSRRWSSSLGSALCINPSYASNLTPGPAIYRNKQKLTRRAHCFWEMRTWPDATVANPNSLFR